MEKSFIPLLFAGDINVYSVARAFHEEYRIKPYVYGKFMSGPCIDTKIMHYTANPQADCKDTFLQLVTDFADKHSDTTVLLVGCGDSYVQLMAENKQYFPKNVIAPYIDAELMNDLIHKEKFYARCEKIGVDYPDTFVHRKERGYDFRLPFDGPFIIKPSNGIEYWRHPFATQKKVYKVDTRAELEQSFKKLLEDIGYVGFSNFDIKYDQRDGKYKVFEINTRQGRSNFYVTGAGANITKYLVEDYIYDRPLEFKAVDNENLWMVVPKKVAFDYIKPEEYRAKMKRLIKEGRYVNPLLYKEDNKFMRKLRLFKSLMGQHYKFRKYLGK